MYFKHLVSSSLRLSRYNRVSASYKKIKNRNLIYSLYRSSSASLCAGEEIQQIKSSTSQLASYRGLTGSQRALNHVYGRNSDVFFCHKERKKNLSYDIPQQVSKLMCSPYKTAYNDEGDITESRILY